MTFAVTANEKGEKVLTMAEYIERETAIAWFMPYAHAGESIDADVVISDIKGMKAADVAPVRHAKWVDNHCTACGMMPMGDEMWKNRDFEPPLFERFMDYCPNCGAKMDKEEV